jgi:hypothetical protein
MTPMWRHDPSAPAVAYGPQPVGRASSNNGSAGSAGFGPGAGGGGLAGGLAGAPERQPQASGAAHLTYSVHRPRSARTTAEDY